MCPGQCQVVLTSNKTELPCSLLLLLLEVQILLAGGGGGEGDCYLKAEFMERKRERGKK